MKPFRLDPFDFACICRVGYTCEEPGKTWPEKCGRCLGARKLSASRVASIIGEDRQVIYRTRDGRVGREVGARVVAKLVQFFPEAFAS